MAAAGRGVAPLTDAVEKARWRRQAVAWLRSDLEFWAGQAESGTPEARAIVARELAQWKAEPDLAGIRDEAAIPALPADEQRDCRALWADVRRADRRRPASMKRRGRGDREHRLPGCPSRRGGVILGSRVGSMNPLGSSGRIAAMRLAGKTALVTGAARGIGRGIALELARAGADVAINDRGPSDEAAATVAEIQAMGRRSALVDGDAFARASCGSIVDRTIAELGRIDILVSNPAFNRRAEFLEYDPETFERVIAGTLTGGFHMSQLVARHMVERGGGGKVVFISSCHVKTPYARSVAYNAAKSGLNNMAFTIAAELYKYLINVNVIEPGWIDTPGEHESFGTAAIEQRRPDAPLGPARHPRGHRQGGRLPRLRRRRLHHRHRARGRRRHLAPLGLGVNPVELRSPDDRSRRLAVGIPAGYHSDRFPRHLSGSSATSDGSRVGPCPSPSCAIAAG